MITLTTAQAARELGVSSRRVVALIASGRLRAEKPGRDWVIRLQDLDAVRERRPGRPGGRRKTEKNNLERKN